MMNNCTIQQQPEIGDLYAQEDQPDQELHQGHQEEGEGEAQAYEESVSVLPRLSNLSCFGSPTGTTTNHLNSHPFRSLSHNPRSSAHNLPRPGPRMKRRLPLSKSKIQNQLMLEQEQEDLDYTLRGFTKITLPANFSGTRFSRSPERRMPISSTPSTPSPVKGRPLPVQQHGSSPSVPVPSLPPLLRTSSDPTPASIYNVEESLNSRVNFLESSLFFLLLLSFLQLVCSTRDFLSSLLACECFSYIFSSHLFNKATFSHSRKNLAKDGRNINNCSSSWLLRNYQNHSFLFYVG